MSADSPRRSLNTARGLVAVPSIVPPQVVSDRSILDSAIGLFNEVTLAHQPHTDPKDTITWARFETAADISDPRFGEDWELDGNVAPPLLLILGYGLGVQVWAIPANGEAVEVLSWRHGIVSALRVLPTPSTSSSIEENGRADEPTDAFAEKRPLIALVDGSSSSGSQPQFCAVNFISLKTGTQVKAIKFKNPVIDVLANRSSIVITFHERIAVFDARTLEDRLSITTCYPSPGINPNPVALGPRWLAYAEHKLLHSKRSGGGCDGEGVASYTATVLNASKSLVKGLRELGEQVAAGLTGTTGSGTSSKNTSFDSGTGPDAKQPGIITVIDIKNPLRDYSPTTGVPMSSAQTAGTDPIIAHFIAHSEALVAMEFDNSGMLLVTADRRGHDFHVFRIQPNPVGPSLAAVHHLYVLHRGDTSAKVQNIAFSLDSRWVAVSTLRGTTHVFPITPYGGPMGVRTHTSLHVVNKLSRFHRSAGLSAEGRSNSPISHSESTTFSLSLQPYHNATLPPYPRPTVVMPLAQLRQPFALGSPPGSATLAGGKSGPAGPGSGSQRQRLSSLSDDSGKPLSVCAIFAKSRSWLLDPPNVTREAPHRMQRKAVDSLFVMAGHGALIQYDLDTKLASNVAKEKICDDTPIELEVEAKAQWNLGRRKEGSQEIMPPLSSDNWLVKNRNSCMLTDSTRQYDDSDDRGESWLAQVEIVTHAGPHRRLWMGPQFVFKTYNTPSGSNLSHVDSEAVEIGTNKAAASTKPDHSSPLNMPLSAGGRSSAVPVLIESGSYSSIEQSPKLMDRFRHDHLDSDYSVAHGDTRLKEDLADAMRESPSVSTASKESGGRGCETTGCSSDNIAFYDALAEHDDDYDHDDQDKDYLHHNRNASAAALASALPNIHSYDNSSSYESIDSLKKPNVSIEKIVNPLGTVTTVTSCLTAEVKTDILDEVVSQLAAEDTVIHENCDESLFRPVVAIFCDEKTRLKQEEDARKEQELCQPPENISNKLIVPVIAKEVDDALNKKEKQKNKLSKQRDSSSETLRAKEQQSKFEELSSLNRKCKVEEKPKAKEEQVAKESGVAKNEKKEETISVESKEEKIEKKDEKLKKEKVSEQMPVMERSMSSLVKTKESEKSKNLTKEELPKSSSQSVKTAEKEKTVSSSCKTKESVKSKSLSEEETLPVSKTENKTSMSKSRKSEERELVVEKKVAVKETTKPNPFGESKKSTSEKESSPKPSTKKSLKTSTTTDDSEEDRNATPERELSPKPSNATKKALKSSTTTDESEDDKPIEFKRMTPVKAEIKPATQKPLTKKELKKQQQQQQLQKAKEEENKLKETEKNKKEMEQKKKEEEEILKMAKKSKESEELPEEPAEVRATQKVTPKNDNQKTIKEDSKEEETKKVVKEDEKSCKTSSEVKRSEVALKENENPQAAIKSEKTAPKENDNKSSQLDTAESPKTAKKIQNDSPKPNLVKTEQLNVKDLADSLIELDSQEEEMKKDVEEEKTTPVLEAVEIFKAPEVKPAISKKNKKKGQKSGSSSESEEVVEVPTEPTTSKKEKMETNKKSSLSSEGSSTDLADSLLERKERDMEQTMYISFSQIEERKAKSDELKEEKKSKSQEKIAKREESPEPNSKSEQKTQLQAIKKKDIKEQPVEETREVKEKSKSENENIKEYKISVKEEEPKKKEATKSSKITAKDDPPATKEIQTKTTQSSDIEGFTSLESNTGKTAIGNLNKDENKDKTEKSKKTSKEEPDTVNQKVSEKATKLNVDPADIKKVVSESKKSEPDSKQDDAVSKKSVAESKQSITVSKTKEAESKQNTAQKESPKAEVIAVKSEESKKSAMKSSEVTKESTEGEKEKPSAKPVKGNEKTKSVKESSGEEVKSKGNTESEDEKSLETTVTIKLKKSQLGEKKVEKRPTKGSEENEKDADAWKSKKPEQKAKDDKAVVQEKTSTSTDNASVKNESDKTSLVKTKKTEAKEKVEDESDKEKIVTSKEDEHKKTSLKVNREKSEIKDDKDKTMATKEAKKEEPLKTLPEKEKPKQGNNKTPGISEIPKKANESKKETKSEEISPKESFVLKLAKKDEVVVEQPKLQRKEKDPEAEKPKPSLDANKEALKTKTTPPSSPKKKQEATKKSENEKPSKEEKETKSEINKTQVEVEKKTTWANITKQDKSAEDKTTKKESSSSGEEYKIRVVESSSKDTLDGAGKNKKPSTSSGEKSMTPTLPPPPVASAWKTLSGAEMISQNLNKQESTKSQVSPSQSGGAIPKFSKATASEKLLPELPTPKEAKEPLGSSKTAPSTKKSKNSPTALDDFPILKPLDALPPLPSLEPLELLSDKSSPNLKDISLINFESPLQENPALERKITPPPRGFTEQNLIFALCGSLHYENEQRSRVTPEKSDVSPTTPSSSNRSSSALDEPSMADYKSLTENDDPYISLEQSSQDTYTTNTNTTNDKFSSSTNSSGTEEIIIMEEKKMTKKQKRKRQQQLLELQKQKEQQLQQQHHHHHSSHLSHHDVDDDELRPLIAMSESQIENVASAAAVNPSTSPLPSLLDESFTMKPLIGKSNTLNHSTTTDSEGPMPATTSDDNVFIMPSAVNSSAGAGSGHQQHKIKTKKLEHKINLMAAIEAATSSSTSSAEESGVELGGSGRHHECDDTAASPLVPTSLISAAGLTATASTSVLPMSMAAMVAAGGAGAAPLTLNATAAGALKKKTKRRKR
ncbi:titin isoform X1 [Musca domestica]|uniref:Titin isoform X2 n=1 Tax=Musca domestica TaxID=7370 RepID=A0A1I8M7I2_MUSDO|nr:titin isoform X1 [Musca domestica]XP_019890934.1 titin isoform X1 [Musca domestica]